MRTVFPSPSPNDTEKPEEVNQIVGISSYRDSDLTRRYLGSSVMNVAFVDLMRTACAVQGNCQSHSSIPEPDGDTNDSGDDRSIPSDEANSRLRGPVRRQRRV